MDREKIIETLKEILLVFIVIGMLAGIFWIATLALVYTGS
jgi:F0F1-type ATP synthase assembly protein I